MSSTGVYPKPKKRPQERAANEVVQASRVRNRKEADFQNMAIEHELKHTLKTYDTMKHKAAQGLDFEQRKFLQNLSKSSEHLGPGALHGNGTTIQRPGTSVAARPGTSLAVPGTYLPMPTTLAVPIPNGGRLRPSASIESLAEDPQLQGKSSTDTELLAKSFNGLDFALASSEEPRSVGRNGINHGMIERDRKSYGGIGAQGEGHGHMHGDRERMGATYATERDHPRINGDVTAETEDRDVHEREERRQEYSISSNMKVAQTKALDTGWSNNSSKLKKSSTFRL